MNDTDRAALQLLADAASDLRARAAALSAARHEASARVKAARAHVDACKATLAQARRDLDALEREAAPGLAAGGAELREVLAELDRAKSAEHRLRRADVPREVLAELDRAESLAPAKASAAARSRRMLDDAQSQGADAELLEQLGARTVAAELARAEHDQALAEVNALIDTAHAGKAAAKKKARAELERRAKALRARRSAPTATSAPRRTT